jgi:hypothetical protein
VKGQVPQIRPRRQEDANGTRKSNRLLAGLDLSSVFWDSLYFDAPPLPSASDFSIIDVARSIQAIENVKSVEPQKRHAMKGTRAQY